MCWSGDSMHGRTVLSTWGFMLCLKSHLITLQCCHLHYHSIALCLIFIQLSLKVFLRITKSVLSSLLYCFNKIPQTRWLREIYFSLLWWLRSVRSGSKADLVLGRGEDTHMWVSALRSFIRMTLILLDWGPTLTSFISTPIKAPLHMQSFCGLGV